jgi:hypothetical protein
LFRGEGGFDCDDAPTFKLDFPLVPLLYDWLNCLPDRFAIAVDGCGEGVEGADGGWGSASGVLYK